MPDDGHDRSLLAGSWDALVFGAIVLLAMISIGAGIVAWVLR